MVRTKSGEERPLQNLEVGLPLKREVPRQQHEEDHAKRPDVHLLWRMVPARARAPLNNEGTPTAQMTTRTAGGRQNSKGCNKDDMQT